MRFISPSHSPSIVGDPLVRTRSASGLSKNNEHLIHIRFVQDIVHSSFETLQEPELTPVSSSPGSSWDLEKDKNLRSFPDLSHMDDPDSLRVSSAGGNSSIDMLSSAFWIWIASHSYSLICPTSKHLKIHVRPFIWPNTSCGRALSSQKDVDRHFNGKHGTRRFFCPEKQCKCSIDGFTRARQPPPQKLRAKVRPTSLHCYGS